MNSKLFVVLVIILTALIIASLIGLIISINKYREVVNNDSHLINGQLVDKDTTVKPKTSEPTTMPEPTIKPTPTKPSDYEEEYILPSDKRLINKYELDYFDQGKLNLAYNEIFARHGHDFKSESLKDYFSSLSWYEPEPGKTVSLSELSSIENDNLKLIKEKIDEIKG